MSFWFVSVVPKYLNFATFSNNSLAILIFWFCSEFWWQDIIIYFVSSAFTFRPTVKFFTLNGLAHNLISCIISELRVFSDASNNYYLLAWWNREMLISVMISVDLQNNETLHVEFQYFSGKFPLDLGLCVIKQHLLSRRRGVWDLIMHLFYNVLSTSYSIEWDIFGLFFGCFI
jgi:hypothetical protein